MRKVNFATRCLVTVAALLLTSTAFAFFFVTYLDPVDPRTIFEVGDGNSTPGDSGISNVNCDWNNLNPTTDPAAGFTNTPANPCVGDSGTGPLAYAFIVGSASEAIFTTGGSKDPNPISSWAWTQGSSPDKDTITNGYAASYRAPNGHKILTFGAERFAVNGDSNIGVWFFQAPVGPTCPNGGTFGVDCTKDGWSGAHTNGDILAVSAFTNGGSHPELDVYQWDSTCNKASYQSTAVGDCNATNLRKLFTGTSAGSGSTGLCVSGSPGCATVNQQATTIGWPYAAKFGNTSNVVPAAGFFEGGFDLTAIFGAVGSGTVPGCFSSFLVETRSSQSPSAVLKDFLAGSFPECSFTVSKSCACSTVDANTGTYTYGFGGTVVNTGGADLTNVTITDTIPGGATQTFTCATLATGATLNWPSNACSASAGATGTFTSTTKTGLTNTVTATASTGSSTITNSNGDVNHVVSASCLNTADSSPNCQVAGSIAVTKSCNTSLQLGSGDVQVKVNFSGLVGNVGSEGLKTVSLTEHSGTDSSGASVTGTVDSTISGSGILHCTSYGNGCVLNVGACTGLPSGKVGTATCTSNAADYSGNYIPTNATFLDGSGQPIAGRALFYDKVDASGVGVVSGATKTDNALAHCAVCPFGSCELQ